MLIPMIEITISTNQITPHVPAGGTHGRSKSPPCLRKRRGDKDGAAGEEKQVPHQAWRPVRNDIPFRKEAFLSLRYG
jgi:hypothetical protein